VFSGAIASRYCATVTGDVVSDRIVVPPRKSMPKFSPMTAKMTIEAAIMTTETPSVAHW
jgi:hypothetical protein